MLAFPFSHVYLVEMTQQFIHFPMWNFLLLIPAEIDWDFAMWTLLLQLQSKQRRVRLIALCRKLFMKEFFVCAYQQQIFEKPEKPIQVVARWDQKAYWEYYEVTIWSVRAWQSLYKNRRFNEVQNIDGVLFVTCRLCDTNPCTVVHFNFEARFMFWTFPHSSVLLLYTQWSV